MAHRRLLSAYAAVASIACLATAGIVAVACGSSDGGFNASPDSGDTTYPGSTGDFGPDGGPLSGGDDTEDGGGTGTGPGTGLDGGGTGTSDDGGGIVITGDGGLDEASFAKQFCALYAPCCSSASKTTPGADCVTALESQHQSGAVFNVKNAASCLSVARTVTNNGTFCQTDGGPGALPDGGSVNAVCDVVYQAPANPTKNLGQVCQQTSDCIPAATGLTECNLTILSDGGTLQTCLQVLPGMLNSTPCIDDTGSVGSSAHPPSTAYSCAVKDGVYCSDTTQKCTTLNGTGASCQDNSECMGSAFCNIDTGTCATKIAHGQDCSDGKVCVATDYCNATSNKCATLLAEGAASNDPSTCASDFTVEGKCGTIYDFDLNLYCR